MRQSGWFLVLMLAPAIGGCASLPSPRVAAVPRAPLVLPPTAAWAASDIDSLRYGDPLRKPVPVAPTAAAPAGPPTPAALFARMFQRTNPAQPAATAPAAAPSPTVASAPDIDSLRYGGSQRKPVPVTATVAAPAGPPTPAALFARMFQRARPAPAATAAAAVAPAAAAAMATAPGPAVIAVPVAVVEPDQPYTFDTGDRLRITVFGQDGISNSYAVDAQGNISMPLIGTVSVRTLSNESLARVVADRLRKGFIREPHVSVEVEIYRPFFILGEVLAPGQYPYVPNMTVQTAVAIAGGFTPRAYRTDITVDRPAPGGVMRQSMPPLTRIQPGDTIIVKERWF